MNKKKWNRKLPAEILALKLCEEAGQVTNEITDAFMEGRAVNYNFIIDEINHLIHLATILRAKYEDIGLMERG